LKPTIWIFSIEPLDTRYTAQWHKYLPAMFEKELDNKYNIVQVDGTQKNTIPTPGAFLNFSDTNYWKSSQLCNFLEHHNRGETSTDDHILFTDAWNPTVIQLKYMKDLLGYNWKLHGLFHAGSWDGQDFLGRLIGDAPWVRHAEKSLFHSFDHNYFATDFHIDMFLYNLLDLGRLADKDTVDELFASKKIVRTGWPMEYMQDTLAPYRGLEKRDLILFPHRIAPEKQVEIFRDLATVLPQYEFVVCQDQQLTKHEYHTLLGQAKLVFSANLQETLGISWYEGAVVDAIPMVPNRLSYSEMAFDEFKYPSEWTESFETYKTHRDNVVTQIVNYIENYEKFLPRLNNQVDELTTNFFSCNHLLEKLK
jgi:hypothetical protein